jgi:hypothetical protein
MANTDDLVRLRGCTERWTRNLNRDMDARDYKPEWLRQQCGSCSFWVALSGAFGDDWGVCTSGRGLDGTVRFEHDGCDDHMESGRWEDEVPVAAQSSVAPDGSPSTAPRVNAGIGPTPESDDGDDKDGQ